MSAKKAAGPSPEGIARSNRQRLAAAEGALALADVERQAIEVRKNMARLRELRETKEAADATALWILHTFLLEVFNTSPRLAITSPERQCGKTTLIDILGLVTRCPLPTANATPASIFRVIEMYRPTPLN